MQDVAGVALRRHRHDREVVSADDPDHEQDGSLMTYVKAYTSGSLDWAAASRSPSQAFTTLDM